MSRRIRGHLRSNAVGYVALFIALSAGAYAAGLPDDSVRSKHIKDGQVRAADLADDTTPHALTGLDIKNASMGGHDIIDGDVKGVDIDESSLSTVPQAAQGGTGRETVGSCDPESWTYVDCAHATVTLSKPGRVLVIGTVNASAESDASDFWGECRLEVNGSPITASRVDFAGTDGPDLWTHDNGALTAVTDVLPAGGNVVGVECSQGSAGAVEYSHASVVAVLLSSN